MNYNTSEADANGKRQQNQQRRRQELSIDIIDQEINQRENFSSEAIFIKDQGQPHYSGDSSLRLPLQRLQTNVEHGQSTNQELPGQLKSPTYNTSNPVEQDNNHDQNQPLKSMSTKRSENLWRTSNINEDLIDDDSEEESQPNTIQQPFQKPTSTPAEIKNFEQIDDLEERILTEATPSRNGETERYLVSKNKQQLIEWTDHGTPMNEYMQELDTQENNSQIQDSPRNSNDEDAGPDINFDHNRSKIKDNYFESKRISRSKTAENQIPKSVPIINPLQLKKANRADQFDQQDYVRKVHYLEDDVISGALETKKYFISSQQTMQTEGDNLNLQYTTRSALASERQTPKSREKRNSSLFGSLNLSALRSARQILPKSYNEKNGNQSHRSMETSAQQKKDYPFIPKLELKKNCKTMLSNYRRSCMEGIFLKHLFCPQVPLKWYLIFMIAIDLFMAIADSLSIYSHGQGIFNADDGKDRIGVTISVVFFAIRILMYIPIGYFSIKLFMYDSYRSGRTLYSLKMAILGIFILFSFVSLGFINKDGCALVHIKMPQMINFATSFPGQTQDQKPRSNDCSRTIIAVEIIGLILYYLISCWIILSIIFWIRRSKRDPSSDFLNLISIGQRGRTAVQLAHLRQRPLVKESQLQKRRGQYRNHHAMVDESMQSEQMDDTPARLTGALKREHVNLKVAMKNLVDFKSDSQKNRIQKSRPGTTNSSSSKRSTYRTKK